MVGVPVTAISTEPVLVANPLASTEIAYDPGGRDSILNSPLALVVTDLVHEKALADTFTVAPATRALLESDTVPKSAPSGLWACREIVRTAKIHVQQELGGALMFHHLSNVFRQVAEIESIDLSNPASRSLSYWFGVKIIGVATQRSSVVIKFFWGKQLNFYYGW